MSPPVDIAHRRRTRALRLAARQASLHATAREQLDLKQLLAATRAGHIPPDTTLELVKTLQRTQQARHHHAAA